MRLCRNGITWSPPDSILGDGICRTCNKWSISLSVIGRCNPCRNQIGLNWRVSRSIRLVFCISAVLFQIPLQDQYAISCLNTLHNWNRPLEWSGLPIFQPSNINCTLLHFYMFLAISIPCICPWKKNLVVWRNFRLNRKIAHLNGEKCAKILHFGGKCINYMFLCAEKFSPKFCLWRNKWQIWGMDNISSIWCSTSNQIILLKLQWLCSKHLGLCKNRNLMEMPGW